MISMLATIERCAGNRGMPDSQLANERMAREKLDAALQEMWRAIHAVNIGSSVVSIDTEAFAAFIHDELPSEKYWLERIAEARAK